MMEYKIDAANKILGRLSVEVALKLRGKNDPLFEPSRLSGNKVVVFNTDKIRTSGRKMDQKLYRRHSGYPGRLKEILLKDEFERDSRKVLYRAVSGMLPKNKLRKLFMTRLILYKGESGVPN